MSNALTRFAICAKCTWKFGSMLWVGPYYFVVRPLKINGLFLVQNYLKLDARTRSQNKQEKKQNYHVLTQHWIAIKQ